MTYDPTLWEDGENKYDIRKQDNSIVEEDIKLV